MIELVSTIAGLLLLYCALGILYTRRLRSRIPDIALVKEYLVRQAHRPYIDGLATYEEIDERLDKIPSFDQFCYTYPFHSVEEVANLPRRNFELLTLIFCWKRTISSHD